MSQALRTLLSAPTSVAETRDVGAWWRAHLARVAGLPTSLDRALVGGFGADRMGFAFAAGYHAALGALVPGLPVDEPVALCATEEGGTHPRAILTRLEPAGPEGGRLTGEKRFVTLGAHARALLVVARRGTDAEGRPSLVLARVPAGRDGVELVPLPELPFTPEIPHAAVRLRAVEVAERELLPGDGYADYLKPFRTVEDLHVHAALLGHVVRVARRDGWPRPALEEAAMLVVAAQGLGACSPSEPAGHVALAGLLSRARAWLDATREHWARAPAAERERFARDAPLLAVARQARDKRLEAAWRRLGAGTVEDETAPGAPGAVDDGS